MTQQVNKILNSIEYSFSDDFSNMVIKRIKEQEDNTFRYIFNRVASVAAIIAVIMVATNILSNYFGYFDTFSATDVNTSQYVDLIIADVI
jgi:hypothetical protein